MAKFFEANKKSIKAYVTLHSYGENIIYPNRQKTDSKSDDTNDLVIATIFLSLFFSEKSFGGYLFKAVLNILKRST